MYIYVMGLIREVSSRGLDPYFFRKVLRHSYEFDLKICRLTADLEFTKNEMDGLSNFSLSILNVSYILCILVQNVGILSVHFLGKVFLFGLFAN